MTRSPSVSSLFVRMTACAALLLVAACGPGEDTGSGGSGGSSSTSSTTTAKTGRAALIGSWRGTPLNFTSGGRSFDITMRMKFESSRVHMNARCRFDTGDTLEADTSVRAELTDTHVKTLEANEEEVRLDDLTCNASLGVFDARYRIDGRSLTLTFENGDALALTRD